MLSTLPPWRIRAARTLLGGIPLVVGILLLWAGWGYLLPKHQHVASWQKVPCSILTWGVTVTHGSGGSRVQPGMSFEYRWGGRTYRSSNYDEVTNWVIDLRDFEAEGASARQGPAFCYVNPDKPEQASFHDARLWFPYSLIGGGGLLTLISALFLLRTWLPSPRHSASFDQQAGRIVMAGMAIFLLGASGYFFWQFAPHEALRQQLVRHRLVEIPMRVEASAIEERRGTGKQSHRIFYQARLVYSYEHDNRRWHSDRWNFASRYIRGAPKELRALLDRYPNGLKLRGWIDPEKPWYSTLNPNLHWGLLWNLIPITLFGMAFWILRLLRKPR